MPDHPEPHFQFTLTYTTALNKDYHRAYWRRQRIYRLMIGQGVLLVIIIILLIVLRNSAFNEAVFGVFLGLGLCHVLSTYGAWERSRAEAEASLKKWDPPIIHYIFFDDRIALHSNETTRSALWSCFGEAWQEKTFWVLLSDRTYHFFLPLENFPPEAQAFLLAKLREHNVKIS